jgi:hypothetical protein
MINIIGGEDLYDYLMTMRMFTLIMNKISHMRYIHSFASCLAVLGPLGVLQICVRSILDVTLKSIPMTIHNKEYGHPYNPVFGEIFGYNQSKS